MGFRNCIFFPPFFWGVWGGGEYPPFLNDIYGCKFEVQYVAMGTRSSLCHLAAPGRGPDCSHSIRVHCTHTQQRGRGTNAIPPSPLSWICICYHNRCLIPRLMLRTHVKSQLGKVIYHMYTVRVGMCGIVWNPHFNGSTERANTGKGKFNLTAYPDFN